MFLTNDFLKLRRVYTIVAIILMISYIIVYFIIAKGDFIGFVITFFPFVALPVWYTRSTLKAWSNSKTLIVEKDALTELNIDRMHFQTAIKRLLVQQNQWRVKKRVDQKGMYRLVLDTPIAFYSLGETINITARFSDISGDVIEIESKSKIPIAEFDNDRNKNNVNTIKSFLSATLQSLDTAK